MNTRSARTVGLVLLCLLLLVGIAVGTRLTSDAFLVNLITHGGLLHPDAPEFSDPSGRYRLVPDDRSLPTGPEPSSEDEVKVWLADQWPGVSLEEKTSVTSVDGDPEFRLVDLRVRRNGIVSPASLICVRRPQDPQFRGWVVIFDRESVPKEQGSARRSSNLRLPLLERLKYRATREWTFEYEKVTP